jgi:hypothetical protein
VREHESTPLELAQHSVTGLLFGGKLNGIEKLASFTFEAGFRRVEEIGIPDGGGTTEQKGLNVNRAIARGAFKPMQAAGDVLWRGQLPATVTVEKACACGGHAKA